MSTLRNADRASLSSPTRSLTESSDYTLAEPPTCDHDVTFERDWTTMEWSLMNLVPGFHCCRRLKMFESRPPYTVCGQLDDKQGVVLCVEVCLFDYRW